jgi:hypothetical protein
MDPLERLGVTSKSTLRFDKKMYYTKRCHKLNDSIRGESTRVSRLRLYRSLHQRYTDISFYMELERCRVKLLVGTYIIVLSESCFRTLMSG